MSDTAIASATTPRSRRALGAIGATAGSIALVLSAMGPAAAQSEDPYGPTSTTSAPAEPRLARCDVDLETAEPGDEAIIRLENGPDGAELRVLVGGTEAGRSSVEGSVSDIAFTIPDLTGGTYPVSLVGLDLTLECGIGLLSAAVVPDEDTDGGTGGADDGAGGGDDGPGDGASDGSDGSTGSGTDGDGAAGGTGSGGEGSGGSEGLRIVNPGSSVAADAIIRVPIPFAGSAELPTTGVAAGVLVAMGIALTIVGRSLVAAGRVGQRRALRN